MARIIKKTEPLLCAKKCPGRGIAMVGTGDNPCINIRYRCIASRSAATKVAVR